MTNRSLRRSLSFRLGRGRWSANALGRPIDPGLHPNHERNTEEANEWLFLNTAFTTLKS